MNINEFIKGIIIGVAKIIPGLSGAVLMISFNLYERAIDAITNFFSNPKKNIFFLTNLGLGIILGIVLFSKVISFFITNYYVYTSMLFLGLILGGIPILKTKIGKNTSNYLLILLAFTLMSILGLSSSNHIYVPKNNYLDTIVYFLSGILESLGTVLPGISSTALLMLIGVYPQYIQILGNALNISVLKETLAFVIPFSIGLFIGIIGVTLLVNYLFKKYKEQTFSFILGISMSSVFLLIIQLFPNITNLVTFILSFLLLLIGYLITKKLS